jgi:pimeloyl-[acyl-carrier protein] methyl ester esterase
MTDHKINIHTASGWAFPENSIVRLTGHPAGYTAPSPNVLRRTVESSPEPAILIGWSMGAMACLEAAIQLKDRILALVLISGTARFCIDKDYPHGTLRDGLDTMIDGAYKTPRWTLEAFYRKSFFPDGMTPQMLEFLIKGSMSTSQDSLVNGLKYMREYDMRKGLSGLDIPTLIIHGKKDRIIPTGASEYLSRNIAGSKLHLIENAGHALPMTHADDLSSEISEFLKEFGVR